MKVFVSHVAEETQARSAMRFKQLVKDNSTGTEVFLSSDWDSIPSGSIWFQEIERALIECHVFVALIVKQDDARRLWVNYEVGFARGRGLQPNIILFSGVEANRLDYPLKGIHLLVSGDTNRWVMELKDMGVRFGDG